MSRATTPLTGPHHLRVRVPLELHDRLRAYAQAQDLSIAAAARRLVHIGIRQHQAEERLLSITLATLIACEHALLLLETLLPDGKVRSARLEEAAIRAAQVRLAQVTNPGDDA